MINHPIPKDAKLRPTKNIFSAAFLGGYYDFNTAANTNQPLIKLIPNTIYFVDNFSFAGNISKEDFLSAMVDFPAITISKRLDRQATYDYPIILTQFYEDKPATAFIRTTQDDDDALITLSAKLKQIAPIVGLDPMILTLSFNIFYIDNNEYCKNFADSLNPAFSEKLRG